MNRNIGIVKRMRCTLEENEKENVKMDFNACQKDSKAITLVALIITIIVMLILSGVALSLALGENGIFSQSRLATQKYEEKKQEEEKELQEAFNTMVGVSSSRGNTEEVSIDELVRSLKYQPGDTINYSNGFFTSGAVTGSKKEIYFSIFLSKNLSDDIKKINFSTTGFDIRDVDGTYLIHSASDTTDNISKYFTIHSYTQNVITFVYQSSTAFTVTNNSPISVCLKNLVISFE